MKAYLHSMARRDRWMLLALSLLLSSCCVFGVSYVVGEGWAVLPLWAELLLTLVGIVPFALGLIGADRLFAHISAPPSAAVSIRRQTSRRLPWSSCLQRLPRKYRQQRRQLPFWALFAIMCVLWLPWVIANFPGGTYWDTYWQMWQVYPEAHPVPLIQWADVREDTLTDAWLVDHHPVLTTLLYGAAAWVSDQITGTWMVGVLVLSLAQVLAYAALFCWAVCCFRRWGVPVPLRAFAFALFCLLPSFPVWADCVVKDSTFGLFFFPWFMMLADCLRTRGASLERGSSCAGMVVLALMMCLTKKTGIFIVIATAVVLCWWFRHQWMDGLRTAFATFACQGVACFIVMCIVLPFAIFPLAHISPGGKQEVLGPLFQQTARYAQAHELTEEEAAIIDAVVDGERVQHHYDSDFQDAVKYYYRVDATPEELVRYLGLWVQHGLQDPEAYLASVAAIAGQYVAPTTYLNLRMVTVDTKLGEEKRPVLWNPPELDGLRKGLDEGYKALASVPVVDLPFLTVTYVLWLPCLLAFTWWRRRSWYGLLLVPLVVVVAFCVIAPVFDARYAWPMLLAAPVIVSLGSDMPCARARQEAADPPEDAVRQGVPEQDAL